MTDTLLNAVEVGTQHGSDNLITSTSCSNGLSDGSIFSENCPNETPSPNSAHPLPLKNATGGHETRGAVQQTAQVDKTPQEANLEAKTASSTRTSPTQMEQIKHNIAKAPRKNGKKKENT